MDSTDETNEPLTKPKKERTEKQKEAFEKARQKRQEYLSQKKVDEKKQVLKEIKAELNGKEKKREATSPDDFIDVFEKREAKSETKEQKYPASHGKSSKQICPDSDSDLRYAEKSEDYADDDGSTEEEITVIKRKKRKSKTETKATPQEKSKKKVVKKVVYESESETEESEEEEEQPKPQTRPTKSQQNKVTKNINSPATPQVPRYYFGN